MAERTPVTARIDEADLVRVEWAAEVRGVSRSKYIAQAAASRARADIDEMKKRSDGGQEGADVSD